MVCRQTLSPYGRPFGSTAYWTGQKLSRSFIETAWLGPAAQSGSTCGSDPYQVLLTGGVYCQNLGPDETNKGLSTLAELCNSLGA